MGYYRSDRDLLYCESTAAREVIELVDLIRHSVYAISEQRQNPFTIRGRTITLRHPKTQYSFFSDLWASKDVIPSMTVADESGRRISDLHVTALIYALRQDFFIKVDPEDPSGLNSIVGWYLDPKIVFIDCIPDFFEDFESVYEAKGALGLQGRESDILGLLSMDVAKYVQREYRPGSTPPYVKKKVIEPEEIVEPAID